MEGKKISFGFMKTTKAYKPVLEEKKEFIECVEEKAIRVVGGEEVTEEKPLVIPLKPNTLITAERLKEIAAEVESSLQAPIKQEIKTEIETDLPENETLDQMAARELLEQAKLEVKKETPSDLTITTGLQPLTGEKESTLDDYDAVPIQQFGLAMLRGMGWTPGNEKANYKHPELRPKGLGLGADKVIKQNQKKKSSKEKEEELAIVKNSFVKITTGKYSGYYGKVISLDEDMGRVVVDLAIKNETVSLSEFMMQPVTKSEYDKESKVINSEAYDDYKKNENKNVTTTDYNRKEPSSSKTQRDVEEKRDKEYDIKRGNSSNGQRRQEERNHRRRDSSSSDSRSRHRRKHKDRDHSTSPEREKRKKDKKKSSRRDLSSSSETEQKRKHKSRKKRDTSTDSDFSDSYKERRRRSKTPDGKRDIDKKRKGKKKKRDRDRSPNYRKHRK